MPLKRKRKTETDIDQTGAGAGSEKTDGLTVPVSGGGEGVAQGPSAWNLDAFAPYQPGAPAPPVTELAPGDVLERTDIYPNGLLNGLHSEAEDTERTDVLDLDQLSQKTESFESISQFDKTLYSDHPEQFETTAAYDVSSGNGLTPRAEAEPPELEPLPSIFASFQEQKTSSTPLFDDSIGASIPSFEPLPIAPADEPLPSYEAPEPVAPVFDAQTEPAAPVFDSQPEPAVPEFEVLPEPVAPIFDTTPEVPHFANTTQRFTSDDLGLAPPSEPIQVNATMPSYTGAQTFERPSIAEPELEIPFSPSVGSGRLIVRLGRFSASYEVDRPEILIGRPDPESEIFPEVSIEWDDAISRRHARILHRDDGDYLEDTGSTNGTKLNGVPVSPHDPQQLFSGDLIHVGSKTEIIYYA